MLFFNNKFDQTVFFFYNFFLFYKWRKQEGKREKYGDLIIKKVM